MKLIISSTLSKNPRDLPSPWDLKNSESSENLTLTLNSEKLCKKTPLLMIPQDPLFSECSMLPKMPSKWSMENSPSSLNTHGCSNVSISLELEELTMLTSGKEWKMIFPLSFWTPEKRESSPKLEIGSEETLECSWILRNSLSGSDMNPFSIGWEPWDSKSMLFKIRSMKDSWLWDSDLLNPLKPLCMMDMNNWHPKNTTI